MPVPAHVPPLLDHTVLHLQLGSSDTAEYHVLAAYFVEDGSYTMFKDGSHAVVAAFKTSAVVLISRERAVRVD